MSKIAERLADLEREVTRLRVLAEADGSQRNRWAEEYMALVESIPNCLPDGTGLYSSLQWVEWAKGQLGFRR